MSGRHSGHWPDLELVERHIGLVGFDLVGGEGEAELEDLGFLWNREERVNSSICGCAGQGESNSTRTFRRSSRVGGTRRGRGGGRAERSSSLAADAAALVAETWRGTAVAAVVVGAEPSSSVMVVSWDVLMVELSKRELASGERDCRAETGGESCVASMSVFVCWPLVARHN